MNWLIINLKYTPTGRKLITWSWTNAVQIQKEKRKKIKEKNELQREKWDVEKKSGVMKIEHYSKTCWSREEEARYLQLQMHKLRALTQALAFFKNMEKFILSLDQKVKGKGKGNYLTSVAKQAKTAFLHGPTVWKSPIVGIEPATFRSESAALTTAPRDPTPDSPVSHGVVWISYSRLFFFVRWLNSRGVSYQGQWSVVPLFDRDGLPCSRKAKSFVDVVLEVERA